MLTYALGRGLERYDECTVDAITAKIARKANRFLALVTAIVTSDPFLKRRPEDCREELTTTFTPTLLTTPL